MSLSNINFTDNTGQITQEFERACERALESCGQMGEGYAKMECPVDTGRLRNSINHRVDTGSKTVYIGTDVEYAPYVELGTGKYCTMGGGRQTPWCYQDSKGNWHMTHGQRAQPYIKPSVADHGSDYNSIIERELKNG